MLVVIHASNACTVSVCTIIYAHVLLATQHVFFYYSLTLGACARGTVVGLCVCVCVFVCYRANCYIHHLKVQGEVS